MKSIKRTVTLSPAFRESCIDQYGRPYWNRSLGHKLREIAQVLASDGYVTLEEPSRVMVRVNANGATKIVGHFESRHEGTVGCFVEANYLFLYRDLDGAVREYDPGYDSYWMVCDEMLELNSVNQHRRLTDAE